DRAIKRREPLVSLTKVQVRIAEAHLKTGMVGSKRGSLFQFGGGEVVLVPLGIHGAEVGVRELVERVVLELLVEGGHRVVVLEILPIGSPEIVIGELVVRIYIQRLLESRDRIVTLPQREVGEAEI